MGIYTNHVNGYYTSSDYRDVEPYHGEHFNYHELGIIAASESVANRNAFMKAIALNELASVEQYGTEQVFYEAVNLSSIFEKIKAFFKKIIEKIHKIFHTFVAKLNSWFGSTSDFAKKYEKDIIKNWSLVKNDWEFKGYKFKNIFLTKGVAENFEQTIKTTKSDSDNLAALIKSSTEPLEFAKLLAEYTQDESFLNIRTLKTAELYYDDNYGNKNNPAFIMFKIKGLEDSNGNKIKVNAYYDKDGNQTTPSNPQKCDKSITDFTLKSGDKIRTGETIYSISKYFPFLEKYGKAARGNLNSEDLAKFREDFNEKGKDQIRYQIVEGCKNCNLVTSLNVDFNDSGSYDANEFTEELHKVFYGEDDKEDIEKKDIESMYGGSITSMISFLKDYNKIKDKIEKSEKNVVKSIDTIIKSIDTAQNNLIKDKDAANKTGNEQIVQVSTVIQSFWGFVKECETQAFGIFLQATKDACSQAKQIAVEVIGLSKKMTESYDYSSSYEYNSYDNDFISSVKLV